MREQEALSNLEEEAREGNLTGVEMEAKKTSMAQETFIDRARLFAALASFPFLLWCQSLASFFSRNMSPKQAQGGRTQSRQERPCA